LVSFSVSASLAASSAVTTVRPLEYNTGKSRWQSEVSGSCETFAVKLLNQRYHTHLPVGDEVAPFSAARQSAEPGTNAITAPRAFGCGCAALNCYIAKSIIFGKIFGL
jgi:hypothetical protein